MSIVSGFVCGHVVGSSRKRESWEGCEVISEQERLRQNRTIAMLRTTSQIGGVSERRGGSLGLYIVLILGTCV